MILLHDSIAALRRFPRKSLRWARRGFYFPLLVLPVAVAVGMVALSNADVLGWSDSDTCKDVMELAHPSLVAAALLVSALAWLRTRAAPLAFLAVLSFFVLLRELLGQGSGIVLYLAILGAILYADRHPDRLAPLRESRWALSFLTMVFVCYATSQLLDRGFVKRIGWLLLWDTSWKPPHSSNMEESLEALGGLFFLCAALTMAALRRAVGHVPGDAAARARARHLATEVAAHSAASGREAAGRPPATDSPMELK